MSSVQNDTVAASATGTLLTLEGSTKPTSISISAIVTGTITFVVEVTFDGVNFFGVLASGTVNVMGTIAYPIAGIRARSTAGTGSLVLTILQD